LLERWRRANEAVGQFPRGHADVLRWEQARQPQAPAASAAAAGALSRERAVELALRDAPAWLGRPGLSAFEQSGLRRQVRERSIEVERAWVDAVISRQALEHSRQALEAAELGAELARRMREVGHWSRARALQEDLPLWQARSRQVQAERVAAQALGHLWQYLGAALSLQEVAAQLPRDWAEPLPPPGGALDVLQQQALQAHPHWAIEASNAQRLIAAVGDGQLSQARQSALRAVREREPLAAGQLDPRRDRLSHAQHEALQASAAADRLERQVRSQVAMAHAAYSVVHGQATTVQAQLLELARQWEQETLLRYNGMLSSTWQLLASARGRIEAVDALLQARRQGWHAHLDLQAVLSGLPYSGGLAAAAAGGPSLSLAGH
jgi:outer membrane protein TolC